MANKKNKGTKVRSPYDVRANIIITIIIVAVLVLGVIAVVPKISENLSGSDTTTEEEAPVTVQSLADEKGMSVDDVIFEYGLPEGTTADTEMSELYDGMTVENYAKLNDQTADEMLEEWGITDVATKDTTVAEAYDLMPVLTYFGDEDTFNSIKEYYGLGDEFTTDLRMGEAEPMLEAAYEAMMAAATTEDETTEDTVTDGVTIDDTTIDTATADDTAADDTTTADTTTDAAE